MGPRASAGTIESLRRQERRRQLPTSFDRCPKRRLPISSAPITVISEAPIPLIDSLRIPDRGASAADGLCRRALFLANAPNKFFVSRIGDHAGIGFLHTQP